MFDPATKRKQHTIQNLRAATRCGWLAVMHLLHAVYPSRWTAHKTWEEIARGRTPTPNPPPSGEE